MTVNPPRRVRIALYLITVLGTPLIAYLNAKGILGSLEVTLWSAEVAVVTGLAALNTTSRTESTVAVTAPAAVDVRLSEEPTEYDGQGAPISDH
jgi:hypothetical protein